MTSGRAGCGERWIRWALVGFSVILPLAVWPGALRPFSTIKLQLLAIVVPTTLVSAAALRVIGRPRLPLAMDIGLILSAASLAASSIVGPLVSLPSLALALLGMGWFWALLSFRPDPSRVLRAVALSGGVMAAVALLQFAGLDPFRAIGWAGEQFAAPRMRLFSTLGNPNFVAAFLAGVVPAQIAIAATDWPEHRGRGVAAAIGCGLTLLVITLTGSRGAYLGLGLALAWCTGGDLLSKWRRRAASTRSPARLAIGAVVALVLGMAVVAGSAARNPRPLGRAIEGRLYIWRIAAGHSGEYVGMGLGPGSFAEAFQSWQATDWQAGRFEEAQRQFAGPEDHAHNDYLELLVEQGIAGPVSFAIILWAFFAFAGRRFSAPRDPAASTAGVVALVGVAVVDFPLHRPAELFLFWTLVAAGFLFDQRSVEAR
ncbi:MAG: O-antigen ligase family protein [Vicinamibacterales bacterium]